MNLPDFVRMKLFYLGVCDFRLDFETFSTNGPADTEETDGGVCQDMLTATTVNQLDSKI